MTRGGKRERGIPRPDPAAGPWAELACGLQDELYVPAGRPSVAAITRGTFISTGHVHKILAGSGRSSWDPVGRSLVGYLGGDLTSWQGRWELAERRYQEGLRTGAVQPLPWIDSDAGRSGEERLGVDDWDVMGRVSLPGMRRVVMFLAALLGIAAVSGLAVWRPGMIGLVSAALAVAALLSGAAWQVYQHRHRARESLRRRQVMIKEVQVRAAEIMSRKGRNALEPRFSWLRDGHGPGHGEHQSGGPNVVREPVAEGATVSGLFGSSAENLVIISAPGLGKTTQLAELAHGLACEALARIEEFDTGQRREPPVIPLFLSLDRYRGQPLGDWIADEVKVAYGGVPAEVTRAWLEEGAILPLLDGLDQVPEEHRQTCAREINKFRARCTGMAVTCRERDYQLARTVEATRYAELARPTRAEVQEHLAAQAEALADVRAALQDDASLWELLQSPLMLNVIEHTYAHRPATELREPGTADERRGRIFDAYLRRMLCYRRPPLYPRRRTLRWLTWLARTLTARGESVLYLDRLDQTWLWEVAGQGDDIVTIGPVDLVCLLAVGALGLALSTCVWVLGACAGTRWPLDIDRGVGSPDFLLFAGFSGMALMSDVRSNLLRKGVGPVERVTWTWRWVPPVSSNREMVSTLTGAQLKYSGLVAGMGPCMSIAFVDFAVYLIAGFKGSFSMSALPVIALGMNLWLGDRLVPHFRERRSLPNEGIRRSARYFATAAIGFGLVAGTIIGILVRIWDPGATFQQDTAVGAAACIYFGLSRGLSLGGYAVLRHFAIRMALIRAGAIPVRFVRFLRDAEQRILLQRDGSGFAFPHRLLQEHLATTPEALDARVDLAPRIP